MYRGNAMSDTDRIIALLVACMACSIPVVTVLVVVRAIMRAARNGVAK